MSELTNIERNYNPFPIYRKMCQEHPVYFDPQRGSWNIFRYEDVDRVLSDYEVFSSHFRQQVGTSSNQPFSASLISSDPPRHRQLRSLVTQAFTPRSVEQLAPRIQTIVDEHLDQVMAAGEMDVVRDLSYPLPVIVIAELLGIPAEDRERFKHWSDIVVGAADFGGNIDYQAFNNQAVMEMSAYFMSMIEQRRQQPGDDLISGLLAAQIEGEHLSEIELLGFCALLLVAGNETTTNLLVNAMYTFSEHPETWQRLRAEPALLPDAIEEVLRYRSPVQAMFRFSTKEVTLQDQVIPANSPLIAWIGSANHDEAQFQQAERFIIDRSPNKHLAFGKGIHYCLGAPLARLEAKLALGSMLQRFASLERKSQDGLQRPPSLIVYGLRSLPVRFMRA
jgi:cytochrome P450